MKDRFGRQIEYLRVSLTDRCNLRCTYCMPEEGIKEKLCHDDIISLEETYELIKHFVNLGIKKIRFTGGEPLVRKGILTLIERVRKLDGVEEIALTTNGILLKKMGKDLKKAGLDRVNISLDTLDANKYKTITRGGSLSAVLEGIEEAKRVSLTPIKINAVLMGGFNDSEIKEFVNLTYDGIDVRFIELMPIGEGIKFARENFISNEEVLKRVKELVPIEREDKSSPAKYYKLPNSKGKVGLINPISCKFCHNCNRVRITSTGQLKACLHSNNEIDLIGPLRNALDVEEIIKSSILEKEASHNLEEDAYIDRNMNQIGG